MTATSTPASDLLNSRIVLSLTELSSLLGMDRSTLTRNLRPLESEGLIAVGLEGWRRSRALEITAKGRSRMQEALPLWRKAQQALRRKLGDKTWDAIHGNLDHLIQAA